MEGVYENLDHVKAVDLNHSENSTGPRSFKRSLYSVVTVLLGLLSVLLLVGLIVLGVHCHISVRDSAAGLSAVKDNMTELLQTSNDKLSSMTEERDLLNSKLSSMTEERDLLNTNLTEITKELERLQRLSEQKKTCPAGWTMFSGSCFFLSEESGSWDRGRQDCRNRGADLVVIESSGEQIFVSTLTEKAAWIGLSDRQEEGAWKWVDGTPVTLKDWGDDQPDNGGKDGHSIEEDCGHIRAVTSQWNDLMCETSMQWICEKLP